MKYKNLSRVSTIIVLFTVVILSGCSFVPGTDKPRNQGMDAHQGTQGVEMQFVHNSPPQQLFYSSRNEITTGGNTFNVMAELKNRGAYDVTAGRVFLSGFDKSIISFDYYDLDMTGLEGKTNFNPEGGYQMAQFSGRILDMQMDRYPVKFLLSACYDYLTVGNPLVCIDPRPYSDIETKACRVNPGQTGKGSGTGIMVGGGQGAPIAITSVEEEATANSLYFRIKLQNSGGGIVFDYNVLDVCPYALEYGDLNRIRYRITLGNQQQTPLKCEPDEEGGVVRMVNGQGMIYCIFEMPRDQMNAYETPLNIELEYAYKKDIERMVEIRNIDDPDFTY